MFDKLVRDKMNGAALTAAPINKDWIEGGDPRASLAILAYSDDRATSTILWECTAGKFTWRYSIDETIYFLDGEVMISVGGQPAMRYGAGRFHPLLARRRRHLGNPDLHSQGRLLPQRDAAASYQGEADGAVYLSPAARPRATR